MSFQNREALAEWYQESSIVSPEAADSYRKKSCVLDPGSRNPAPPDAVQDDKA